MTHALHTVECWYSRHLLFGRYHTCLPSLLASFLSRPPLPTTGLQPRLSPSSMGPKRKKSKPNPDDPFPPLPLQDQGQPDSSGQQQSAEPTPKSTPPQIDSAASSQSKPNTWLPGGSWRSKASPVARIARESISVAKGATSESSEEASRRPSQSLSKGMPGSRKSIPLVAEATKIHATSDAERVKSRPAFSSEEKLKDVDTDAEAESKVIIEEAPLPPDPSAPDDEDARSVGSSAKRQTGAWFGWWSRPDGYGSDGEKTRESIQGQKRDVETASSTPLPGTPVVEPTDAHKGVGNNSATKEPSPKVIEPPPTNTTAQWEGLQPPMSTSATPSRSWFNLWSSAQYQQAQTDATKDLAPQPQSTPELSTPTEPASIEQAVRKDEQSKAEVKIKPTEERTKSAGWAFWSSDKPGEKSPGESERQVGELAVADTPSQSHPEAAQFNEQRDESTKAPSKNDKQASTLPKRGRGDKAKVVVAESPAIAPNASQVDPPPSSFLAESTNLDDSSTLVPVQRGKKPQNRPNSILPTFRETYPTLPNLGYLDRLTHYLAQTLRLPATSTSPPPIHVNRTPSSPKIRRAIAIGVHGFFPAPLIQRVLGQPTGTSIRFANYAAASIKAWCEEHQPHIKDIEIEKVALEGEGFITDRVSTLWKLLLNWLSHLRQADFVFVACHSQGVPVATMLVAKLIQLGCLSPNVKIGICAMAGINLGPFPEYKSRLFGGTALELFEFADPHSKVSKSHAESLDICLRHGVRMTLVGSMDDQLVSLESSLFAPLSHPYVCRAVFIDGRLHTPNFLTHLVVFALKLRNLGISDHGLIRELSGPLAGSLVGGEGHSRVYDDPAVYSLAVDFTLGSTDITLPLPTNPASPLTAADKLLASDKARARENAAARRASLSGYPSTPAMANRVRRGSVSASTSLPGIAPIIAHHEPLPASSTPVNPFYLPWAVRGMLEEEFVKRDVTLWAEVGQLVEEFEEWRPTSKVLKDVRWRLEGVRSML